jgi:hypothetical protein
MVDEGWVEVPLLRLVPTPYPEWIVAPGALVLAVSTPPGVEPYDWYKTVALAWARSPSTGVWAALMAWEAMRRIGSADAVLAPRWAWCRIEAERCQVMKKTATPNPWELQWWGGIAAAPMAEAMEAAAASLPPELRKRALTPAGYGFDFDAVPALRGLREAVGR